MPSILKLLCRINGIGLALCGCLAITKHDSVLGIAGVFILAVLWFNLPDRVDAKMAADLADPV